MKQYFRKSKIGRQGVEIFKHLMYAGHTNENSADVRKQIIISSLFSIVAFGLMLVFGFEALQKGYAQLAMVVLAMAGLSAVNYLYLRNTGNYRISSTVIVLMMTILCIYLLCTGGISNTGPLWMFILPGLIFYIMGLKPGCMYISLLLSFVAYILLVPDNGLLRTEYSFPFTIRFFLIMCSAGIVGFVYEYTREDGRKELLALSRRLDSLSRKDELTGLSNRRDMFERLRSELNRVERSGRAFSVLIADIDHFKSINDTHGHECGDYCLKGIAELLLANTQKRDGVARWGGEEFLVLLSETTGPQAEKIAERLREALQDLPLQYEGNNLALTMSVGVAEYVPGQTLSELINIADSFLYRAKHDGRNRVKRMTDIVAVNQADQIGDAGQACI